MVYVNKYLRLGKYSCLEVSSTSSHSIWNIQYYNIDRKHRTCWTFLHSRNKLCNGRGWHLQIAMKNSGISEFNLKMLAFSKYTGECWHFQIALENAGIFKLEWRMLAFSNCNGECWHFQNTLENAGIFKLQWRMLGFYKCNATPKLWTWVYTVYISQI